jgi:hypothetical protein
MNQCPHAKWTPNSPCPHTCCIRLVYITLTLAYQIELAVGKFYPHSIFLSSNVFIVCCSSDSNSPRSLQVEGHISRSRNSAVGLVTSYGVGVRSSSLSRGQEISSFSKTSRPNMGPTQPPVQCVPGDFSRVNGLGVNLHLTPRLRMSGVLPLLPLHASVMWKRDNYTF